MGAITSLFVRKIVAATEPASERAGLLASVGLEPAEASGLGQMISADAYYDLLERIARRPGGALDLPIRTGASMRCDDYGAFGLGWKTAPTLRDSFARAERYWRLLTSVSQYEVRPDGPNAYYLLHRAGERRLGLRLSNEATLASVVSICREVSRGPFRPLEAHFQHRAPESLAAHRAYFGCPLLFESAYDGLLLSGDTLTAENRLGDAGLARFMTQHLDAELASAAAEPALDQDVRAAVTQSLSGGPPRMGAVAKQLGLSERTLQRRLKEDGLSFQALVDDARRELAQGLLTESAYSLADVAFLTGFSEQSAFTRAFKRWRGQTPAAFRDAARTSA